jgi:hypothetical protein
MSYPINYPTPQGANIQIFQGGGRDGNYTTRDWVKPQKASFVWFTLIGGGAAGDGGINGGGSGAVTNFMGPAFLIPDMLTIFVGTGGNTAGTANGTASSVKYIQKTGSGYDLLVANGGNSGGAGGNATGSNNFSAMGFFQSVTGQAGINGTQSASATTFLSGGASSGAVGANYGYSSARGLSQISPIIVGTGAVSNFQGGTGCGGGESGKGGDGLVVIVTW